MDHTQILKRAWNILWNYNCLWAFGFSAGAGFGWAHAIYNPLDAGFQIRGEMTSRLITGDTNSRRSWNERCPAWSDISHRMMSFWIGVGSQCCACCCW